MYSLPPPPPLHSLRKLLTRHTSPELFDEYTRRQYVAKAPERNPFGTDEVPISFNEFDIFTKVRAAHAQLPMFMAAF